MLHFYLYITKVDTSTIITFHTFCHKCSVIQDNKDTTGVYSKRAVKVTKLRKKSVHFYRQKIIIEFWVLPDTLLYSMSTTMITTIIADNYTT